MAPLKYTRIPAIYIIVNLKTNKVYIGQTSDIHRRQKDHIKSLTKGNHRNRYLQRAWNKYGEKAFKFKVLEYCSIEKLDEREQHFLDIYIPKGICYNIALDAKVPSRGAKRSKETREKIRQVNLGKTLTEEHKRKISIGTKGHKGANKGGHVSPETLKKMSDAQKGKKLSDEAKKKISDSKKNMSPEYRAKLSEAAKIREAKRRLLKLEKSTD